MAEEKTIVFYCRDCETLVDGNKKGRKYIYNCSICNGKRVAFGTKQSIAAFYHLKEAN